MPVWLTSILAKVTGSVVKSGADAAKAVVEAQKAIVETEKGRLEVAKLRDEVAARQSLIAQATFDDIRKFDPKYGIIERANSVSAKDKQLVVDHYPEMTEYSLAVSLFMFAVVAAYGYGGWKWAAAAGVILVPIFYFVHRKAVTEAQERE